MYILQLDPPLSMTSPRGDCLALFLLDYGMEQDLYWICFMDDTGECWTFRNAEIRLMPNISYGAVRKDP